MSHGKEVPKAEPAKDPKDGYQPPRIRSQKVFEMHSLVSCGKGEGNPSCYPSEDLKDS